jgi:hypothetical protein
VFLAHTYWYRLGRLTFTFEDPTAVVTLDGPDGSYESRPGQDFGFYWNRPGFWTMRVFKDKRLVHAENFSLQAGEHKTMPVPNASELARNLDLLATDWQRLQGRWQGVAANYVEGPALGPEALPLTWIEINNDHIRIRLPGLSSKFEEFGGHKILKMGRDRAWRRMELNGTAESGTFRIDRVIFYRFEGENLRLRLDGRQPLVEDPHYRGEGLPIPVPENQGLELVLKREVAAQPGLSATEAGADGFVPLFNGRDLTGWKTHPDQPGDWRVENGILVGRGPRSHLFSKRGDYENFHLRVEARINHLGNSGVYFRSEYGLGWGINPKGYEAQIFEGDAQDPYKTGSLYSLAKVTSDLVKPDTWFTLDVIVQGNRTIIQVNGKTAVDFVDEAARYKKGHFALQVERPPRTIIQFRKIEVNEIRPARAADATLPALRDLVAAKERERDMVKMWFDAGRVNPLDMLAVEVELTNARLRLAEADHDTRAIVARLEELVAHRKEERRIVAVRVEVGASEPDALDRADGRLAEAQAQLAKARSQP